MPDIVIEIPWSTWQRMPVEACEVLANYADHEYAREDLHLPEGQRRVRYTLPLVQWETEVLPLLPRAMKKERGQ